MDNLIRGAKGGGGKGGGGSSHTHYEAPDSLQSIEYARVLDVIGEGPIKGLVNGLQSVYLNDTPVQNADGTFNFQNCAFSMRTGLPSQDPIPGFPAIESETSVSTQVKQATPVVRRIADPNVNAARVTIGIPSLLVQNTKNGDVNGTSVAISIDVNTNGAGWVPTVIGTETINIGSGKQISSTRQLLSANLTANWTAYNYNDQVLNTASYVIESSDDAGSTWSTVKTGTFSGYSETNSYGNSPATDSTSASITLSGGNSYAFRIRLISGVGSAILSGSAVARSATDTITGKTRSRYQRSYRIPLSGAGPWDIRVTRITADSTDSSVSNDTWWDSFTAITDYQLSYPNTAYVGINVDAKQFSSIPTRKYLVDLMVVQVPSSYDPVARTYTGTWDGTFKTAWTDNPAWCFYDMVTNSRYGLGRYIPASLTDKWALYTIGQYCDELVPDGFGGMEPRFRLNVWINSASAAYDVLQSMVSAFRGMLYASGGSLSPVADMPATPKMLYTAANVIDGLFTYQGSPRSQRHSIVNVTWQNPDNSYKDEIESVDDAEAIARYGVRKLDIKAFGCTSRGQAHRMGLWALYSEKYDNLITFKTGLDKTATLKPGDIIEIADPNRAGARMGGRVAAATTTHVDLDAPVTLTAGVSYTLKVLTSDGSWNEVGILPASGSVTGVDLVAPLPSAPLVGTIWLISSNALAVQQARIISIKEASKNTFELTAIEYNAAKYAAIEQGLTLATPVTSNLDASPPAAPGGVTAVESLYEALSTVKSRVSLSWNATPRASQYYVEYRRDSNNWSGQWTNTTLLDVDDTQPGIYQFRVYAANTLGNKGPYTLLTMEVFGLAAAPSDIAGLDISALNGFALLSWPQSPDLDVRVGGSIRVKHSPLTTGATWPNSTDIGPAIPGSATQVQLPLLQGTYLLKAVDSSGVESINAVMVTTTAPAVMAMNIVQTLDQSQWLGAMSYVATVDGAIKLDSADAIDVWPDVDSVPDWDSGLGVAPSGIYSFDQIVDVGAVQTCRISSLLHTMSYATNDLMDAWTDVDSRNSWDGLDAGSTAAEIQISTTNVDPAMNKWSGWSPLRIADYSGRAFRFQLVMQSFDPGHAIVTDQLSVTVDMPDRIVNLNDVAIPSGGLQINFSPPFMAPPTLGISGQGLQPGENIKITARTNAGFFVTVQNASGVGVARSIDVIAKGYGGY
ncbi:host specificity protein J [Paludibacterium denitrificans]|uniref:Tip attachment protein J domain-containing protein n=1 Tax=Paludibacterium denitrificans TaxID=2675226 RepID=A0A844GFE5_9NEIS|nr:phage tail protein [Paludibacterium denitrificans]MTD34040.1 hypothetical protein [Paludibacterium denitrificans]